MALKMQEVRAMTDEILSDELEARRARLFHARFEARTERNSNALVVRTSRREIAQMLTVMSERAITAKENA